jgi:hypothetical protein
MWWMAKAHDFKLALTRVTESKGGSPTACM